MRDKINWKSVPVGFSYCARDECGSARLFAQRPLQTRFGWARSNGDATDTLGVYGHAFGYRQGSYDWDESLIERN